MPGASSVVVLLGLGVLDLPSPAIKSTARPPSHLNLSVRCAVHRYRSGCAIFLFWKIDPTVQLNSPFPFRSTGSNRPLRPVQDVLEYKRAVPFTMFTGGVGRHAQGKLPISKDYMGDPSSKTVRKKAEGKSL